MKQPKTATARRSTAKSPTPRKRRYAGQHLEFPRMKGRKVEKIEIFSDTDHHSIVIEFQDKTALDLEIEPSFTLKAVQEDFRSSEVKVLRRWPAMHSQPWNVR